MTKLLIVESPKKAETIQTILGADFKVMASYGHVRDLPQRELGIDGETFELQYELGERGGKVVGALAKALTSATQVYLATDPDREGEAISWHLKAALKLKESDYWRVTFNAINEKTILAALSAPRKIDQNLVRAQEGRRALDRLVGYKVSPMLWDALGPVSAGRVQSPAVRAVVDREAEIAAFRQTKHFGAVIEIDGGKWKANWDTAPFISESSKYVLDESLALQAACCRKFKIIAAESGTKPQAPPAPLTTSTLLQAASVALKFSPGHTAKLAQALFEGVRGSDHGFISYHRTDSKNFSAETLAEIREFAIASGLDLPERARTWKEKGDAQGAHEAIRPSDFALVDAGSNDDERALYRLIRERALASQLADAVYSVNTVRLESLDDPKFVFAASGRTMVSAGWRVIGGGEAPEELAEKEVDGDNDGGAVPVLEVGQGITASAGDVLTKLTRPPPRYTEASLVKRLEDLGIGRPSTYPSIMGNIVDKAYVLIEKRNLQPTPLGTALVTALKQAEFAFIEYAFTRDMELQLDELADGRGDYRSLVSAANAELERDIANVVSGGKLLPKYPCPTCGSAMRRVKTANGTFWSCSGYRTTGCKSVMDDKGGEPVPRLTYPCPDCSKPMYRRQGNSGPFWACSGYADGCKCTLADNKGKPGEKKKPAVLSEYQCPKCSSALVRRQGMTKPKTVKGKKVPAKPFDFFGCSGYPKCDGVFRTVDGRPELPTA